MKPILYLVATLSILGAGCRNGRRVPDVSGIKVNLTIQRFDKDLFDLDTNRVMEQLPTLIRKYPNFTHLFLQQELNLQQAADSPAVVERELREFLTQSSNLNLKDSVFKAYGSVEDIRAGLEKYFRYVKYYYPDYQVPVIITFIGNFGKRELYTQDGLGIQLNFYMGSSFSYYQIPEVQEIYADFLSRKFSKEYIPVNCMAAVVDDIYPDDSDNDTTANTLMEELIERGKRLYVLDKFIPDLADTLKLGYTGQQFQWCNANEGLIWNFLIEQDALYSHDPDIIKNYMTDAPTTQGMPPQSPGDVGSFVGWQIVKKYIDRKGDPGPQKMMAIPDKDILNGAQYNPKKGA